MNDLLQQWLGVRLLDPWLVCLWLPVPWLLWRSNRALARPAVLLATAGLATEGKPGAPRRRHLPALLQALALLALAIALGRPVRRERLAVTTLGIDAYLCIDTSSSMLTPLPSPTVQDQTSPTRLAAATAAAADFIRSRPDDRFGLVRFARYADLASPLTLDHQSVQEQLLALRAVQPRSAEDLTGIGTAMGRAGKFLRNSQATSRVIILLTDGEETVATPERAEAITPQQAAVFCRDAGIRVYGIVVGTGDQEHAVDTRPLGSAVEATGGRLFEARDAQQLQSIYRAIGELEVSPLESPRFRLAECFGPFAIAALLLWLLAEVARSTWARVTPC